MGSLLISLCSVHRTSVHEKEASHPISKGDK